MKRFKPLEDNESSGRDFTGERQKFCESLAQQIVDSLPQGRTNSPQRLREVSSLKAVVLEKMPEGLSANNVGYFIIIIYTLISLALSGCMAEWNDDDQKKEKPSKKDAGILDIFSGTDIGEIIKDVLDRIDRQADIRLEKDGKDIKEQKDAVEPEDESDSTEGIELDGAVGEELDGTIDGELDGELDSSTLDSGKDATNDSVAKIDLEGDFSFDLQQAYLDGGVDIKYDVSPSQDRSGELINVDVPMTDWDRTDFVPRDLRVPDQIEYTDFPQEDWIIYRDIPRPDRVFHRDRPTRDQESDLTSSLDRSQIFLDWRLDSSELGEVDGFQDGSPDSFSNDLSWDFEIPWDGNPDSSLDSSDLDNDLLNDSTPPGKEVGNDFEGITDINIDWIGGIGDECDPSCLSHQVCSYDNECVTSAGLNCDPGNTEICDGEDNTCDGVIDPYCTNLIYELCDGIDNNDNQVVDENCISCEGLPVGYELPCGNGIGECEQGQQFCQTNEVFSECFNSIAPSIEICDNLDNDCDGQTDEGCNKGYSYETDPPDWWFKSPPSN